MIYTTGTIAGNGNTITGTGTNFTAAGSLIRVGCTLITFTNPVQVLQLTAVTSANALSVTPAISPAIAAGTRFAILLSDSLSVDGLAQDIAETFGMYQRNISGFADVMNGSGDVTITIDGKQVTVPGQKSLAKKGENNDITKISGLTTPLAVNQGGLGTRTVDAARQVLAVNGTVLTLGSINNVLTWHNDRYQSGGAFPLRDDDGTTLAYKYGAGMLLRTLDTFGYICVDKDTANLRVIGGSASGGIASYAYQNTLWGTRNTIVDNNGFIKQASPVVKIFSDGEFEVNDESEGVTVTRSGPGDYLIEGCVGLNADASWGGTDGGFEIPVDRNKQARIWLDYEVNADGTVLVKTYHRTYPDAPSFARNLIGIKNDDGTFTETVKNGELIDIPADSFVSVRVEMPADSIWNQKTEASRKGTEQASRKALEESKAISNLKEE